jgi:hypothetical protein
MLVLALSVCSMLLVGCGCTNTGMDATIAPTVLPTNGEETLPTHKPTTAPTTMPTTQATTEAPTYMTEDTQTTENPMDSGEGLIPDMTGAASDAARYRNRGVSPKG